jgi:hypothetical protein
MSGFNDMFSQLDQQTGNALAPPAPPPKPTGMQSMFDALDNDPKIRATSNLVAAQSVAPEHAAAALQASRATGIPQPAAEENLDQAKQSAQLKANVDTLDQNPNLANFVADNPLAARLAQDDFQKLGTLEQLTTALKTGVAGALMGNELGRQGSLKQVAGLVGADTPAIDQKITGLQGAMAAQPKLTGGMGFVQNFTGFLTGLVDNAIQGGGEGGAVGAGIGAGLGAVAGGVGALPGAMTGSVTGSVVGFNVDMARVAAGNAYLKMGQIRGADGQPLSEGGKQFGAIFTGAATYALGTYASKIESALASSTAESLAQQALAKAVQSPTFTQAVKSFAGDTFKGAAQGAGIMTAMEASGIIGEEIAKAASSGHFETNPQEIVDRLADAAINGAVLLGAMHGSMHGLSLYGDLRSAQRAESQAAMFKNLLDGSTDAKLRERDLQGFQQFMQSQTDGTPVENLYLPADKVRELYQGARIDPSNMTADPLFSFVPDMAKQLQESAANGGGGDVVIRTSDFVTHLAGTPLAEHLLPDLRVGADAMSVNEAKAFQAEYQERIKAAVDQAGKGAEPDSTQKIADEVQAQAKAAGYSDTLASRSGAIYAARYAARGERMGMDPYEAFKESGVVIQPGEESGPVPESKTLQQSAADAPSRDDPFTAKPDQSSTKTLQQGNRGAIRFEDGKKFITLLKGADASTLMHEGSHAWLEEMVSDAANEKAPQQARDDMATVREWLGNDGGDLTTEQHEQFARAGEAYLMEGKAPSVALGRVFSRFKQWLTKLYRTVRALDTPINDDIRGVFDRLLATDAEIDEAKRSTGLEPNFKSKEDAGMTTAEWNAYTGAIDKANAQAESTLLDKMMARVRRQRTAEYKEERAKAVETATTEVDARPDIQALTMLRSVKADAQKIRLSSADIESVYGKDGVAAMPKGTLAKDGVHPDYVAEMLGFNSGDELVKSLQSLEKQQREIQAQEGEKRNIRKYLIDQAADQKMEPHSADMLDEQSIREEAQAAVHSESRAALLAQELRYLKRSAARALEERGKGRKAAEQVKTEADWNAAEADLMAKLDKAQTVAAAEEKAGKASDKAKATIDELKQQIADLKMTDRWKDAEADMVRKMDTAKQADEQRRLKESVLVTKETLEAIGKQVDGILDNKTTDDIGSFGTYLRDERKAARMVQQAILKKDWSSAAAAKQRQLISHILYTKAKAASDVIDKGSANMKRLTDKKAFKSIDQEYTDQIQDLLRRFGFDSDRGEELQRALKGSLEDFVKTKSEESGIELSVDPSLYTLSKDVKSLTYAQFKALDEAVRSMQEIGRGMKMIEVDGQLRDVKEVKAEIVAAIRELGERMKSDFYDPRDAGHLAAAREKLFGIFRGIDASLTKPEALFDQIDKGNAFGIMNRAIFRRLKEAQGREDAWHEVASKEMKDAVETAGKDWAKHLSDVVPDEPGLINPETGRPMKLTRKRMISMALNWGNEGNRIKLAEGYKWKSSTIQQFLNKNMTKADWDFAQRVWKMFDSHKQDLDDLQRRVTGVGLDMVQADAFDTPHGRYEGGYYPIVYDAGKSYQAEAHAEKATEALFPSNYTRATTPKGSTISRVDGVKRPIQLSLDVAPWKIGQTIHDLAFREAIIDADRLLSSDSVKKAMDDVFGPEYRKMLRPWLKHIANSKNIDDAAISWMDKAISTARTNTVIVGIGFRLSTMFKHGFSALSNSFKEVGPEWMLKGTREFYAPGRLKENWDFITSKSAEMKYRMNAYDKDVTSKYKELLTDSAYTTFQKQAQHFGHLGVSYLDLGSAAPTWLGAYRKALSQGMEDKDAVYVADKTVRNAHGAQGITDTSQIQRTTGVANLVNMFYGFFNHIYNRQRTMFIQGAEGVRNTKAGDYKAASKNFADVLATSFWYLAVPALVEAMATNGGPSEKKDEGWGEWASKAILAEIPAGIPVIRDIAKAAIEGRDYEVSPIAKAVTDVLHAGRDISDMVQGLDPKESMGKHIATAAGYIAGLPTAAPFTAGKFLWDINNGDADPQSIKDWYQGLTRGKVTQE